MIDFLTQQGYTDIRQIEGFGFCGLYRFAFTTGLVIGLGRIGYVGRYCYSHHADAKLALLSWDGTQDPSGDWIKYKGEGVERENIKIRTICQTKNNTAFLPNQC